MTRAPPAIRRLRRERALKAWGTPVLMVIGFAAFVALHGARFLP